MPPSSSFASNKKFFYKCDGHSTNISQKLLSLYEKGKFFDTTLIAGTNQIKIRAHSIVLTALSEYFSQLFLNNQTNSKNTIIKLREIKAFTLKLIIDFMYSGCIELTIETVESIFRTAAIFKLQNLKNACYDFMEKNTIPSHCWNWLRLAKEYNLPTLQKNTLEYCYANFQEVTKQNGLMLLNEDELKDFLLNKDCREDFEDVVFLSLFAWIEYDCANREHLTSQFLSIVRYQLLTPEAIIAGRKIICKVLKGHELICSWLQWHFVSPTNKVISKQQNISTTPSPFGCQAAKLAIIFHDNEIHTMIRIYHREMNSKCWTNTKHKRLPMNNHSLYSSIVIGTKLFAIGGCIDGETTTTNSVECLDLVEFSCTNLPPMRKSRNRSQVANLNGNICVFGGSSGGCFVDSVEIYNSATKEWYELELLYTPSKDSKIVAHNGTLYIFDFENGLLQCYDSLSNEWTCRVLDKKQLRGFSLAGIDGFLYIIGGKKDTEHVNTVMRYDISKNRLCDVASMPNDRSSVSTVIFRNKIVIFGGFPCWRLIEEYNPDTDSWKELNPVTITGYRDSVLCTLPSCIK